MTSRRSELRNALEAAETRLRAFRARSLPSTALGGKAAEPVTDDFAAEIARLEEACEAAREALRDAVDERTARGTPEG